MKRFVTAWLLAGMAALGARAFDSAAWLEKRADLSNEVARLQAAYRQCVQALETPAEDVALPLETYPDGAVKTSVQAKRAQYFLQSGLVWAEGVVVRTFKPDGSPDLVLEAESGVQYTAPRKEADQVSLSAIGEGEVLDALRRCQPDTLTPIEAMTLLYELKRKLQ